MNAFAYIGLKIGKWFRTNLHQLYQREIATVFQPSHVCVGAGRVQEGRYSMGDDELWFGFASLH